MRPNGSLRNGLPHAAAVLAYAGALPPIASAILILARPEDLGPRIQEFMLVYGCLLIAFFGGVRWGVAVMRPEGPSFGHLLGGVIPLIVAMPLFYFDDPKVRFAIILAALPLLLFSDLRATRAGSGAPDWYLGVRAPLTGLMFIAYAAAFGSQLLAG